jgi:outer membrane murein-binding lipoprotein Lpp
MKKGLLTVLLASLVLVGCQNYDDQFDDLNAQISALKSQVDGLSSLSGQVSSLSGTISGLSSGVAAAQAAATAAGASADAATAAANAIDLSGLSASLATLQTEVDAVQASLATAATASAVTALQAELDAIETDLADLLATSNIYSTDVTVTNATTLNSALALGNKLNVLNATLTITGYSGMDYTKVQTLADRVNTMTGNLVYSAASSTGTEITFNNLVSAGNITMTQPKGYSFPKLANAAAIRLNSTYETTVTNISFPVLTSATSIDTDAAVAAAFDINFTYATNVDFGAMVTAPGNTITITTKKDATLDMDAYKSTDATGNAVDIDLTLNGPASFTNGTAAGTFASTGLPGNTVGAADGTISLTNVATAAIHNFRGGITLSTGVKNFTGNNIVTVTHSAATDLETMNVTMMRDNDPGLSAAAITAFEAETNTAQSISVGSSHTKLTSLTVTGTGGDVTADTAPALTTVNLTGLTAMDVVIDNNVALTSFTDATANSK